MPLYSTMSAVEADFSQCNQCAVVPRHNKPHLYTWRKTAAHAKASSGGTLCSHLLLLQWEFPWEIWIAFPSEQSQLRQSPYQTSIPTLVCAVLLCDHTTS